MLPELEYAVAAIDFKEQKLTIRHVGKIQQTICKRYKKKS